MEAGEVSTCKEYKKYITLLVDEMHIKEDLVYNKATGIYKTNSKLYICAEVAETLGGGGLEV